MHEKLFNFETILFVARLNFPKPKSYLELTDLNPKPNKQTQPYLKCSPNPKMAFN